MNDEFNVQEKFDYIIKVSNCVYFKFLCKFILVLDMGKPQLLNALAFGCNK